MATVAITLLGAISLSRLKVNLLPDLSYPTLTIRTELPGAAPTEVENLISRPIEEAAGVVRNVRSVRSVSRSGQSDVIIEFTWGTDMDFAGIEVRERLDLLWLPIEATRPLLLRFDPSSEPVMRVAFVDASAKAGSQRRPAEIPAPLRRRPHQAGDRIGRRLGGREGQRRLRRRGADLRRPAAPRAAAAFDRTGGQAHRRGEREPLRRPARTGHAALPGTHGQRIRHARRHGELGDRQCRRPAGVSQGRRARRTRLQGSHRHHAPERRRVHRARHLQGRRRQHRAAGARHHRQARGAREDACPAARSSCRSTTSPSSSRARSAT